MNALEPVPVGQAGTIEVSTLLVSALRDSQRPNTRKAYTSDWSRFTAWCDTLGAESLPAAPQTVAEYLVHHGKPGPCGCPPDPRRPALDCPGQLSPATLDRRLSSIAVKHKQAGYDPPTRSQLVLKARRGLRNQARTAAKHARPLTTEDLRQILAAIDEETARPDVRPSALLRAVRDRAMLLIGFAALLRRSELAALEVGDLTEVPEGLDVRVRSSKTDTEGAGVVLSVAYGSNPATCPVRAWRAWRARLDALELAGPGEPVLRRVTRHAHFGDRPLSDAHVDRIIKARARQAGLPGWQEYSGHSLRAGGATVLGRAGEQERRIMAQGRWKSVTVARRYIDDGGRWRDPVSAKLGL